MAISIKILNQTVIRPFVRNKKSRANFTSVWIPSLTGIEKHFEGFVVNIVHGVFECDENQLGRFFQWQLTFRFRITFCDKFSREDFDEKLIQNFTWNVFSTTGAIGQLTHIFAAFGCCLVWCRLWI